MKAGKVKKPDVHRAKNDKGTKPKPAEAESQIITFLQRCNHLSISILSVETTSKTLKKQSAKNGQNELMC